MLLLLFNEFWTTGGLQVCVFLHRLTVCLVVLTLLLLFNEYWTKRGLQVGFASLDCVLIVVLLLMLFNEFWTKMSLCVSSSV